MLHRREILFTGTNEPDFATITRVCTKCHVDKPLSEYTTDNTCKYKRRAFCKDCGNKIKQEWYARDRDKNRAYATEYKNKNYARWMCSSAKSRAKQKGWEFDLTEEFVQQLLDGANWICPILKIPLARGKGQPTANSPSLDRIDNARGYVKGNVRIISHRANLLKRDSTPEERELLYLADQRDKHAAS